jgi:hypothetical protein
MKSIKIFVCFLLLLNLSKAEFALPPEITSGLIQSSIGESGGLYIGGVDEEIFTKYITTHWKSIVENIEVLHPKKRVTSGTELNLRSVSIFAAACEQLPPLEYIDFLERILELFDQNKIDANAVEMLLGTDKKHHFLSVNWEHPRVRVILAKVIKLIPAADENLRSCVEDMANGKLADNYMTDKGDDDPRPETLPGIKLVRPWDSLLKKYERMTGKKIEESYDPQFNPRPEKVGRTQPAPQAAVTSSPLPTKNSGWPWVIVILVIIPIIYCIWCYRKYSSI